MEISFCIFVHTLYNTFTDAARWINIFFEITQPTAELKDLNNYHNLSNMLNTIVLNLTCKWYNLEENYTSLELILHYKWNICIIFILNK